MINSCIVNWELWHRLQQARPIDTEYKYSRYQKDAPKREIDFSTLSEEERKLYSAIEDIVIRWSNDGTKTGGTLTRQILYLFKNGLEDDDTVYCPICEGCGEDGCCSATCCQQSPLGHYCKTYLRDLKFGYQMHKDMWPLIPEDAESQAKLDKVWNDNYDIFYRDK